MKKLISTIAASVMAVSSLAVVSASAYVNEDNNAISVSTETITNEIITESGDIIPAGATAVTVSIDRNSGFKSKSVKLDLGTAEIVTGSDGSVIVEMGTVLEDALINGAENNGIAAFAIASATENVSDGDIFTFYTTDSANVSILDVDYSIAVDSVDMPMSGVLRWYTIGDIDKDNRINACDATDILVAIRKYKERYNTTSDQLPVSYANNDLSYYFANRNIDRAEAADTDIDQYIDNDDANNVLSYYSALSVGNLPENIHIALSEKKFRIFTIHQYDV